MIYRLTGIIRHRGSTLERGHYIAYFSSNGMWFEANDMFVTEIDWQIVRALQAYVLFYERI